MTQIHRIEFWAYFAKPTYLRNLRKLNVRVSKTLGKVEAGEIPVRMVVEIPDTYFTRPQLEMRVTIPGDTKEVITAEVAHNIEELIRQNQGINVKISYDEVQTTKP